ncbi:autotransporter domain-containing protein [Azospirillum sp. B4]|uniref:autotransporter domain-containing protein n=1 Tax=Azospirillum sp. B4 TaxID=95605 RepID=UPI00034931E4|nr:autotransporter domain-containing protein [Azospirillum sp. B4]
MLTAALPRSKALLPKTLLLGASVLALSAAWQGAAHADTTITGNSGPVTISSGGLNNSGTISTPYYTAVSAAGALGTIANSGTILFTSSYPYRPAVAVGGNSGSATTLDLLSNSAGATIQGYWTGILVSNATIGTISNSGVIATNYVNYGSAIKGAATIVSGSVVSNTIGQMINAADGTVTSVTLTGGSIGSILNEGIITGAIDLGATTIALYSYTGTIYTVGNQVVQSTIGRFANAAGATISGGVSLAGAVVGTISNAGVIGGINLGTASGYTQTINGTVFTSISSSITGRINLLANAAGGTIGIVDLTGSIGTIDNAGSIGSSNTYYGSAIRDGSSVDLFLNEAGGTISGFYGVALTGTNVGTLSNSGVITGNYYYGVSGSYGSHYDTAASRYVYGATTTDTLTNGAGASIIGNYGGVVYVGSTIGTLNNDGLIAATQAGVGVSVAGYLDSQNTISGVVGTLNNGATGTISGAYAYAGVGVSGGTIIQLNNDGMITTGTYGAGIAVSGTSYSTYIYNLGTYSIASLPGIIGTLINSSTGTIQGGYGVELYGDGHIGTLQNNGQIRGTLGAAIELVGNYMVNPSLDTLINGSTGTISGATGVLVESGTLSTLVNNGLITGTNSALKAYKYSDYSTTISPSIDEIINNGILSATSAGSPGNYGTALIVGGVNVGTITNSGLITGATALYAMSWSTGTDVAGTIGLIDNLVGASIIGTGAYAAVELDTTVDTLRNSGLIANDNATSTLASALAVGGTLNSLLNLPSGTISGPGSAIAVGGTIGILGNGGLLTGGVAAIRVGSSNVSSYTTYGTHSGTDAGGVGTLSNTGTLTGGMDGIQSSGLIATLNNNGVATGDIGAGIANLGKRSSYSNSSDYPWRVTTWTSTTGGGTIGALNNSGVISGGQDGILNGVASAESTVVTSLKSYWSGYTFSITTVVGTTGPVGGTIGTLMNSGTILGAAGAGIDNGAATAVIGTLVNSGVIQGGQTGIINVGTIGALTNSGTITGAVAAIRDSGTLGPVINTGVIAGNIIHTAASDLTITGGAGTVVGTLTGANGARGTLSSAADVTLAGNLVLNDSVSIAGHTLVENGGTLALTAPTTVTGNYAQTGGTLAALVTGGTVGGLQVSGSASISGATVVLTSQYAYGLTSGTSYTIVAAGDATSSYASVTALAPGYTSTTVTSTVVGGLTDLIVSVGNSQLTAGSTATIAGGNGTLDQMTGGSLSVTGGTPTVGSVSGGTISLTGGSATLGTISGGTLVQTTGSTIAGATAVQVIGGSLYLGGTVTAPLAINGGVVAVNGQASGTVTVGAGGTLRGSGVVNGQATVSGVLAPGNSPGTLTFTNGLTQGAKSVLSIDIDGTGTGSGAGNYSRVLVTGGSYVIGSGAVLQPKLRGITGNASNTYTPGLGTDFTVVQAAGGVQGTFAGVTQPASGLATGSQFTALYSSNAVDLFVTPTYTSLAGASANQQTMGRVVAGLTAPASSDLTTVLRALYSLPTMGASLDALAQMGGSAHANIVSYSLTRGLAATQVLGQRLAAVRDGVTGGMQGTMQAQLVGRTLYTSVASGDTPVEGERGMAAGSAEEDGWHFWAQGLGAFTRVDSDGNAAGGHSNTGGGLFGGDRAVAPGVTLGLAGVLLQSTSGGANETSSYGLSAYGNVDLGDGLFVTGNAGYTYDQYDTARTLGFGGLSRTAFGHTTGDELSAGVTAGYRVRVSNLTLEPQAGIQWLRVGRDGFTETGAGALDLVLQDLDATALQSSVGGRAAASWKTDGGTVITPSVRAAWLHDFRDRALTSQAALAGTTFAVTGPDTGANALGIGGGLTLQEGDNLNLYANYDGTLRRHETDHVFTAGFRLSW